MPSHGQHVGRMPDDAQPGLTHGDHKEVEELSAPRAPIIYEVVRRQGEEELDRPDGSLFWSGARCRPNHHGIGDRSGRAAPPTARLLPASRRATALAS